MPTDPVCGMYVPETSDLFVEKDGEKYYFCSKSCMERFTSPEEETRKLRSRLIVGWSLSIPIIILTFVLDWPYKNYLLLAMAVPVQFYSGLGFYSGAYHSLKTRTSNMDLLVTLGTLIAFIFSVSITVSPGIILNSPTFFDASAFIITMILTGNYIENLTKVRAGGAARKLLEMIPATSHYVKSDGSIVDGDTDRMKPGDRILVKAGEVVVADGIVFEGSSEVDESLITGEQNPVLKENGDKVISGTKNLNGSLTVEVTNVGKNSTVSLIHDLLEKATFGRSKVQRIADVFSSVFVPVVLSIAAGTAIFWFLHLGGIGNRQAVEVAILSFVSVVVIACPCAIGLAGPITFLVSSTSSSGKGIIIRNPGAFDRFVKVNRVVFDKTGTITEADPSIHEINVTGSHSRGESLLLSASLEKYSNHPIAKAIVKFARDEEIVLYEAKNVVETPGRGIKGDVAGKSVEVTRSEGAVGSRVMVYVDGEPSCEFTVSYRIREQAKSVVEELKRNGIRTSIVTGDSREEAERVANEVGIEEVHSQASPEDKSEIVKKYQMEGDYVLFVGDGINDSIAMEVSDVGVAMGSGTDIAKESGDIILLNNDLRNILRSKSISEKTLAKVKQNLGWAVGYNTVLIPIGAGILVPLTGSWIFSIMPIFASFAMGFSSTSVVINSLFLRRKLESLQ
ncbi:ATPase [uncultured archaeon]|nr:ATPase [uncultured archaeon]